MIDDVTEEKAIKRLRRIQGQLGGIERMITSRRYCIDVVTQISAAEAALHNLKILRNDKRASVLLMAHGKR